MDCFVPKKKCIRFGGGSAGRYTEAFEDIKINSTGRTNVSHIYIYI